ncbi:MAG: insulinase family protein [Chloroflexi bacterium]|nr:insulinase family protein [Chloroflexota bacterium]
MHITLKSVGTLICLTLMVVVLVACGSDPETSPEASPTATTAVEQTPVSTPEPTPAATPTATPVPETPTATPEPTVTPAPEVIGPDGNLIFDPAVVRGTLSNGMAYYIRHNQEPRERAHLSLVVKAGSVLEEEEQRGLAHFVEHMAFNGTERFAKQEIIEYLESIGSSFGAHLNAYTSYDETVYFLEIPTDDPEILEKAFQILSDWAYAISFDPEEVELERGVVLEEWRLGQGFDSRWRDGIYQALFGSSRYSERSPIGLPEVIETAPVEQLRAYYERWYRPELMALVAVGDFDPDLIEAKITQYFAPPPEGEAQQERAAVAPPATLPAFEVPGHEEPRIDIFTDPEAPGTQLILVQKTPPDAGRDLSAFRRFVAQQLAFQMLNARLFERGQVADPPYLWTQGGQGGFVRPTDIVTFSVVTEQDGIEAGFAALLEELQRVRQHGFTASELAREKINLLSSVESRYKERDQRDSGLLVSEYRAHFLTGTPVPGAEAEWELYQQVLPQVSLEEVDALAESWSETRDTVLLVLRPEDPEASTDEVLSATMAAQLEGANALQVEAYEDDFDDLPLMAALPTPGTVTAEAQIESIDAVRWTLSNGITVIAKQTDFQNDEVLFTAFSAGGHSLASDEDHVSALYAADIASGSGVGLHDSVTLDKLLAGKRVSVAPYISALFEGLSGTASPEDLETLFQLITLYVTEPRFDEAYFSTYEARLRTNAEGRTADPDSVFFDKATSVLRQGHFRSRTLTLDLLAELDFERAQTVYADRFADFGDATFVFVGAFDWDELRDLTSRYLASLPSTGRAEEWVDHNIDPPPGVEEHVVRKGIEPRSQTILIYAGDAQWSREEALTVTVAGEILGTRLRERVREELGGTYAIGVSASINLLPDSEYLLYVLFGSDPARVEELTAEVEVEIAWLRDGGEQSYLDTVKEQFRTSREEQLRENSFWLGQIGDATQRGESLDVITGFDQRLESLTLEEVAAAARRYLPDDRYIHIVLLPEDE